MHSFAQDSLSNDILSTLKLRKGIYLNVNEFKTNSPSVTDNYEVIPDTGKFDRYWLYKKGKKVRNVYGYSNGEDIYINAKVYGHSNYFVKILILGPIIYFEDQRHKSNKFYMQTAMAGVWGGALGGAIVGALASTYGGNNPGFIVYVPDEDGQAYFLNEQSLVSIFTEADQELLKSLNQEKGSKSYKVLLQYLVDFNKRAQSVR
ncbi:MAG: hypothetical protein SH819_03270 [Cytophagales bacterium]|nr:hypothetical protein [Cytophagales bacterium]